MIRRRLYLDEAPGETRAVVTRDGAPERLIFARESDPASQALGAQAVGRIVRVAGQVAFVDLGRDPEGVINLRPEMGRLAEGRAVRVEVRSEARAGKGANLRWLGEAEGPPRLVAPPTSLRAELERFAPDTEVLTGAAAREAADLAEAEALQTLFPLPGGGSIAVDRTRALVAVDVDLGAQIEGGKRAAARANLEALATAARALRLKGEGGLVVIDLAGRGHNGPALIAAARAAFAPDNPGVAIGPVSRFGTIELTVPRRRRPVAERLLDDAGRPTAETCALRLIRAIEREAAASPGARIEARAAGDVAAAAGAYLKRLQDRFGARLCIVADPTLAREVFEVAAR